MSEYGRFGISPKEIKRTIVTAGAATMLAAGAAASDSEAQSPIDSRIVNTDKTANVIDDPNFQGKTFDDFLNLLAESRTAEVELNQDLSNSLPLITRLVDMNRPSSGDEIQNLIAEYRLQVELSGGNPADYQPVILNRFQESTYIENGAEVQTNTWGIPVLLNQDGDLVHTVVNPSNQTVELVVFKKPQEGYDFNALILQNIESGAPVAMLGVFETQDSGIVPQGELPVALLTIDPETGGPSAIPVSEASASSNARLRTVNKPYGEITIIEGGQSIGIIGENTEEIPGFDDPFRYAIDPETGAFGLISTTLISEAEEWVNPWGSLPEVSTVNAPDATGDLNVYITDPVVEGLPLGLVYESQSDGGGLYQENLDRIKSQLPVFDEVYFPQYSNRRVLHLFVGESAPVLQNVLDSNGNVIFSTVDLYAAPSSSEDGAQTITYKLILNNFDGVCGRNSTVVFGARNGTYSGDQSASYIIENILLPGRTVLVGSANVPSQNDLESTPCPSTTGMLMSDPNLLSGAIIY